MDVIGYALVVGIHFTAPPPDKAEVRRPLCVVRCGPGEGPRGSRPHLAVERTAVLHQLFRHNEAVASSKVSRSGAGTQEVYFMGIVDIMTEYGLRKQLEHHLNGEQASEGVAGDGSASGNSAMAPMPDPISYSRRFQAYLSEHLD